MHNVHGLFIYLCTFLLIFCRWKASICKSSAPSKVIFPYPSKAKVTQKPRSIISRWKSFRCTSCFAKAIQHVLWARACTFWFRAVQWCTWCTFSGSDVLSTSVRGTVLSMGQKADLLKNPHGVKSHFVRPKVSTIKEINHFPKDDHRFVEKRHLLQKLWVS